MCTCAVKILALSRLCLHDDCMMLLGRILCDVDCLNVATAMLQFLKPYEYVQKNHVNCTACYCLVVI